MSLVKRPGIPIPSFGSVDVSPEKSPKEKDSVVSPANTTIAKKWNAKRLLQLEISLQFWCRRRGPVLSLPDFFALAKKLDWSDSPNDNTKKDDNNSDLTLEESLLHDLLCVAANPSMAEPLYRVDTDQGKLESLPHRADQMRRALSATGALDQAWSKKVVAMIVAHRGTAKPQKAKETVSSATKEMTATKAIITKGMTIDERVRAKAQARQEHEKLVQKRQLQENLKEVQIHTDKTWTIQLADALSLHARSILQRQNYHLPNKLAANSILQSKATKRPRASVRRCALAFRDVVTIIAKSRLGKASATQIAKALTELEQFSPKWIQVQRAKGTNISESSSKSFKWCPKTTTVFVLPDNYPLVRSQLTGQPLPKDRGTKISLSGNQKEANNGKTGGKPLLSASTTNGKQKKQAPVLSKNLLEDFDDTADSKRRKLETDKKACAPSTKASNCPGTEAVVAFKKRGRGNRK